MSEDERAAAPSVNGVMGQVPGPTTPISGMGLGSSTMSFAGGYGAVQQSGSQSGNAGDTSADPDTRHISATAGEEIVGPRQDGSMSGSRTGGEQGATTGVAPVPQSGVEDHHPTSWTNHGQAQHVTPRRLWGRVSNVTAWSSGLEAAPTGFRWMSRLGEFIRSRTELMPSPFPGASPERASEFSSPVPLRPATPPRSTGLSGFLGANLFHNEPPSSSSGVPTEVIQEEVQRQLRGIMDRLESTEAHNQQLQQQLEAYKQTHAAAVTQSEVRRSEAIEHAQRVSLLTSNMVPAASSGHQEARIPDLQSVLAESMEVLNVGRPKGSTPSLGVPQGTHTGQGINLGTPQGSTPVLGSLEGDISVLGVPQGASSAGNAFQVHPQEGSSGIGGSNRYTLGLGEDIGRPQVGASASASVPAPLRGLGSQDLGSRTGDPLLNALSQSAQQLQALQAQAMSKDADSPTTQENVKPGSISLPQLSPPKDEMSSLHFQELIEIVTITMSDLSDNSANWWTRLLKVVQEAYARYLAATPIERLSLKPLDTGLTSGKWVRVNARACSMLLAVDDSIKQDLIARRISQDMVQSIFRLYIAYQPGGSAEKGHVLRLLQNPQSPSNLQECLTVLRSWPRWVQRCKQVGMAIPDPTVLAASLTKIASPYLVQSQDASFRTQLLRTTLRLEASPTEESVEAYHTHLLAEVEMIVSSGNVSKGKPSLSSMEGQPSPASPSSPSKGAKGELPCKYFLKANGCRRGGKCPYLHDMSQLPRDQRAKKCLVCGSEAHRKRDCPIGDSGTKGSGKRDEGSTKGKPAVGAPIPPPQSTPTSPVVAAQVVNSAEILPQGIGEEASAGSGSPMSIESLIKIAQQIVQGQGSTSSISQPTGGSSSTSLRVMTVVNPVRNDTGAVIAATALVDSGATHPLRKATSSDEWNQARSVQVSLAGNRMVEMHMTESGTLLLPVSDLGSTTIVPVGDLVQTLGYRVDWSRKQCRLLAPDGKALRLTMRDGCPQLPECQALDLIARLEERKLDQLRTVTRTTEETVRAAALSLNKSWFRSLIEHCEGNAHAGGRAVANAPFLDGVPEDSKWGLVTDHTSVNA